MMSTFAVYVLLLKNNKRYVGRTSLLIAPENWNSYNPLLDQSIPRIKAHFDGNGTEWTKKYPPVKVEDIYQNCFAEDEDKYTKILMRKFGIENVRGGAYCQLTLDPLQIIFLEREIRGNEQKCFRCGRSSHWVDGCYAKTDVNGNILLLEN